MNKAQFAYVSALLIVIASWFYEPLHFLILNLIVFTMLSGACVGLLWFFISIYWLLGGMSPHRVDERWERITQKIVARLNYWAGRN